MSIIEISKVLSNKVRIDILGWLKQPQDNFPSQVNVPNFDDGVCVCHIKDKTGLSQSTVSHYLTMMTKAGLLIATRHGKWTYYRRDDIIIKEFINEMSREL